MQLVHFRFLAPEQSVRAAQLVPLAPRDPVSQDVSKRDVLSLIHARKLLAPKQPALLWPVAVGVLVSAGLGINLGPPLLLLPLRVKPRPRPLIGRMVVPMLTFAIMPIPTVVPVTTETTIVAGVIMVVGEGVLLVL